MLVGKQQSGNGGVGKADLRKQNASTLLCACVGVISLLLCWDFNFLLSSFWLIGLFVIACRVSCRCEHRYSDGQARQLSRHNDGSQFGNHSVVLGLIIRTVNGNAHGSVKKIAQIIIIFENIKSKTGFEYYLKRNSLITPVESHFEDVERVNSHQVSGFKQLQ